MRSNFAARYSTGAPGGVDAAGGRGRYCLGPLPPPPPPPEHTVWPLPPSPARRHGARDAPRAPWEVPSFGNGRPPFAAAAPCRCEDDDEGEDVCVPRRRGAPLASSEVAL
mmetsp:Transcript_61025/g.157823  ORF Transcript_61025/g.157823 Transcript_61025/m.157823 type:complete len:110 (+) Transcript_61025:706-1035(+)